LRPTSVQQAAGKWLWKSFLALQYFLWVISMYGDYITTAKSALFGVLFTI
jgi:hypothetical protein